jgi:hemoglobin
MHPRVLWAGRLAGHVLGIVVGFSFGGWGTAKPAHKVAVVESGDVVGGDVVGGDEFDVLRGWCVDGYCGAMPAGGDMTQSTNSLYRRIGGYDVIAAVIDDLFAALRADPAFARFASGRSLDSHNRARQLLVDQMCELSDGPCYYIGRDMRTSHRGLAITDAEWDANMKFADAALVKNTVGPAERAEFLALFERYRDDIVERD